VGGGLFQTYNGAVVIQTSHRSLVPFEPCAVVLHLSRHKGYKVSLARELQSRHRNGMDEIVA
jgi:hypothetical protein